MNAKTVIEQIRKLAPAERQMVKEFVLAEEREMVSKGRERSIREVLSQSPFAALEFGPPDGVRSPVRGVEL